jgi:hypothetical protein
MDDLFKHAIKCLVLLVGSHLSRQFGEALELLGVVGLGFGLARHRREADISSQKAAVSEIDVAQLAPSDMPSPPIELINEAGCAADLPAEGNEDCARDQQAGDHNGDGNAHREVPYCVGVIQGVAPPPGFVWRSLGSWLDAGNTDTQLQKDREAALRALPLSVAGSKRKARHSAGKSRRAIENAEKT